MTTIAVELEMGVQRRVIAQGRSAGAVLEGMRMIERKLESLGHKGNCRHYPIWGPPLEKSRA